MKKKQRILTKVVVAIIALGCVGYFLILSDINISDQLQIRMVQGNDKALVAGALAEQHLNEQWTKESQGLKQMYALQNLLTTIEENLEISGNSFKALQRLQEIESHIRSVQEKLDAIQTNLPELQLAIKHVRIRTDLLLEEIELAKQKVKVRETYEKYKSPK